MKKNRVLVTGGAGFLGSHLCDRLIKDGNDVVCVDNLFTGSKDNISAIRYTLQRSHFMVRLMPSVLYSIPGQGYCSHQHLKSLVILNAIRSLRATVAV